MLESGQLMLWEAREKRAAVLKTRGDAGTHEDLSRGGIKSVADMGSVEEVRPGRSRRTQSQGWCCGYRRGSRWLGDRQQGSTLEDTPLAQGLIIMQIIPNLKTMGKGMGYVSTEILKSEIVFRLP